MKKLVSASLGVALIASSAQAVSLSGSIDHLNKTYESVSEIIQNNQESLYAELMIKEGLIQAIETAETINEMAGINELHPNARYAAIPAGLASIWLTKGGYKITDGLARFILPESGMRAYRARYAELKANIRETKTAITQLSEETLVYQKTIELETQKRLLAEHINTKPGILRKSISTLRGAARLTVALGAITVGVAIVGDALVIVLPEQTTDLLEDLQADVERLEKLLEVVDEKETNE